jgi:hypothetical protein
VSATALCASLHCYWRQSSQACSSISRPSDTQQGYDSPGTHSNTDNGTGWIRQHVSDGSLDTSVNIGLAALFSNNISARQSLVPDCGKCNRNTGSCRRGVGRSLLLLCHVLSQQLATAMQSSYASVALPRTAAHDIFGVELRACTGQALPRVQYDGQEWFVGEPGQEFTVAVTMSSQSRTDYRVRLTYPTAASHCSACFALFGT